MNDEPHVTKGQEVLLRDYKFGRFSDMESAAELLTSMPVYFISDDHLYSKSGALKSFLENKYESTYTPTDESVDGYWCFSLCDMCAHRVSLRKGFPFVWKETGPGIYDDKPYVVDTISKSLRRTLRLAESWLKCNATFHEFPRFILEEAGRIADSLYLSQHIISKYVSKH